MPAIELMNTRIHDHKHIAEQEHPITFTNIENLIVNFQEDINELRRADHESINRQSDDR